MRSRAARLTASAIACIALGVAGYFLFTTEQAHRRPPAESAGVRSARPRGGERAGRCARRAAGVRRGRSGRRVLDAEGRGAPARDGAGRGPPSGSGAQHRRALLLMDAAASITEFGNVDRRARDYLRSGQTLMAGDVVFTEGGETAATAARQVESARLAEHQAFDAAEAGLRRREMIALGAAGAFGVFVMALLALASPGRSRARGTPAPSSDARNAGAATRPNDLMLRDIEPQAPARPPAAGNSVAARLGTPPEGGRRDLHRVWPGEGSGRPARPAGACG